MAGHAPGTSTSSSVTEELYFLIARFLTQGPCRGAAEVLQKELKENKLLPKRIDWEGTEHERSYENLVDLNRHIKSDHLLKICQRLGPLLDKEVKPSVCGVQSLLGAGSQSLLRTKEGIENPVWTPPTHVVTHHQRPLYPPKNLVCPSFAYVIRGREMSGQSRTDHACPNHFYTKINMHARKLGHLSAVYCVSFDRTGHYIFTGADDALIKIWKACNGRLLATLRGHNSEITDIAVNYENTLLASGSCDKTIRVWCLRTKAPIAVLQSHTATVTSLQFCPQSKGEARVLMSTGGDGCVCFWVWDVTTNTFNPKPHKFIERSRAGAQMLCSSFSPGGVFLATGSADHVIRVYFLHNTKPEKISELESHTDRVDSICYCNHGDRFVSGSKDGTARIWRYERQEWRALVLYMNTTLESTNKNDIEDVKRFRVTMVSWNMDDSLVITAVSDFSIKVWNSHTGNLVHILKAHEDEIFVLEHSPVEARIMLSAGHDGNIAIWDLHKGKKIKSFFNMIEGQGHGAVFDCKFSLDGLSYAATDSHGHLLLFGFGSNEKHKKIPEEVFFHTDYRPLMRDANNYVLDEQTQQPPHLMPPPFLVDIDGNPYPPRFQKLVPGREQCNNDQLIPQMQVNEEGSQEVMGDLEALVDDHPHPEDPAPVPPVDPSPGDGPAQEHRPSIDNMIQQLQREQDQRIAREGLESLGSPPPQLGSPRVNRANSVNVGLRRTGEREGVRQSLGNISQRATQSDIAALSRRVVVQELDAAALARDEDLRTSYANEEAKHFMVERKKKPFNFDGDYSDAGPRLKSRHKHKNRRENVVTQRENEEVATNRLVTRALYDTEEEEEEENAEASSDAIFSSDNDNDDGESSEYSDWVGDTGVSLQPPKRKSKRQVKRRKLSSSEDDEEVDVLDDDDDDNYDEDSTRDSAKSSGSRRQQPKRKKPPPPTRKKPSKNKRKKEKLVKKMEDITELPEEFRPPEWLTDVIPRKSPYVPQMGDNVMYFKQGHELYLQAVKKRNVYKVDTRKHQPWHSNPNLREQEHMKIVGIKYEVRPPRLCCLKMAYLDPETGKPTKNSFTVKYHDMPDVIDFIVLKQSYDTAMRRNWNAGDRFRSMIDDAWWFGTIASQSPYEAFYPDSMFQCFMVNWDNGETERLSPWDMEPVDQNHLPARNESCVPVQPEELRSLMYTPVEGEWPTCGRDAECNRIAHGMESVMQHSIAEQFLTPVDLNVFPIYGIIIEYLIDLTTIKSRLENRFYRRISALQFDIRYIEQNTVAFNEPGTAIVKSARILTEALLEFIQDTDCTDPMPILNTLCHREKVGGVSSGSDTEDTADSSKHRHSDEDQPGTSTRRKPVPVPVVNKNPDSWKSECLTLLETIFRCEDSNPFRFPVDPDELPEYFDIIEHPMDLSTVKENLLGDRYPNPNSLFKDLRLIFSNSRTFNTNKRSRIYAMTLRLSAMVEEKMKEIINGWNSAVKQRKNSPRQAAQSSYINSIASSSRSSRSLPRRMAATVASSSIRASSLHNGARPSTLETTATSHSDLNMSATTLEVDDLEDDDDEDYQPVKAKTSSPRKRPARVPKPVEESNHFDSDTELEDEVEEVDEDKTESEEEEEEEPAVRNIARSSRTRGKRPLTNGNASNHYTTRASTGSIKVKHFKKSGSYSESNTESQSSENEEAAEARDSSPASSSSSKSSSSSSGSETELDSKSSDSENSPKTRSKRVAPRLRKEVDSSKGRSHNAQRQKGPGKASNSGTRQTRNQGKRTVRYEEDSDYEYGENGASSSHRTRKRPRYVSPENSESDSDENSEVMRSSRGRIRKLTPRARASLRH
uniref:Bromodomain and WD repeat-containing protein 3-like isoform X1 n=1 Tax=Crassostrea virginica TaxID=6565 RepID=A0A8B8AM79_CRAVI|nr:bromodomain and WD repeat-containing protein 3-like isoform X1 [Crassostrea virginica]